MSTSDCAVLLRSWRTKRGGIISERHLFMRVLSVVPRYAVTVGSLKGGTVIGKTPEERGNFHLGFQTLNHCRALYRFVNKNFLFVVKTLLPFFCFFYIMSVWQTRNLQKTQNQQSQLRQNRQSNRKLPPLKRR